MCLPFKAYSNLSTPAEAADRQAGEAAVRVRALEQRRALDLGMRSTRSIGADLMPVACRVVERREPGAAERMSVLVLDRSWDELAGSEPYVTSGDVLVGFLAERPGDVDASESARVDMLHRWSRTDRARRVAAWVEIEPGLRLDFLVEPASMIDEWPLRCTLLSDPYLAAGLARPKLTVSTADFPDDPLGRVPAGLRIGQLRIWGYSRPDGRFLPIGLFVEPAADAEVINHVVVWRQLRRGTPESAAGPLSGGDLIPVRLLRLAGPGSGRDRWFASAARGMPELRVGAAVTRGERLIGVLETAGWGYGIVSFFGEPGRAWPVTLMPRDGSRGPVDFLVRTLRRDGDMVELAVADPTVLLVPGDLFTGTRSRDCPPGLWIGSVTPGEPERLWVRHVDARAAGGLTVFRRRGGGGRS